MKNPHLEHDGLKQLRERAEVQATPLSGDSKQFSAAAADELTYELDVHRIELEMQNEALRQAQIELNDSYERFSNLYHFAPVSYINLDRHGLIRSVNLAAAKLLGHLPGRLSEMPFQFFVAVNDRSRFLRYLRDCGRSQEVCSVEVRLRVKEREDFFVRLDSLRVKDGPDDAPVYRTVLFDISKYKRDAQLSKKASHSLELNLAKTNESLSQYQSLLYLETKQRDALAEGIHLVLDRSTNPMMLLDYSGTMLRVNAGVERLFGYTRDQLLEQPLIQLMPKYLLDEWAEPEEGVETKPVDSTRSVRSLFGSRSDGTTFSVEIELTPIRYCGTNALLATLAPSECPMTDS